MAKLEEIEKAIGFKFDEWQKEFILAEEPQLILCCGRKCGKTESMATKIVMDLTEQNFQKSDGVCILSSSQRQSRELFFKVREILQRLGYPISRDAIVAERNKQIYSTQTMLKMPNGNKLYALPCGYDGMTLRYYSFYKIYRDEDAYIPDAVEPAVSACLAIHGKQEIRASTPAGSYGSFYNSWHNPDFRRWHRSTEDCPRVTKAYLARERKRLGKIAYEQEYLAKFVDVMEGLYTRGMIALATNREVNWEEIRKRCLLFIGVDFARFGEDENVIALCWYDPETATSHIEVKVLRSKLRTTQVTGAIMALTKLYSNQFKCVVTDEGGVGGGPTDVLIEMLGNRKVKGISNQSKTEAAEGQRSKYMKVDLHTHLIRRMESGKIVLDNDPIIIRSLRSMRYSYTKSGDLTIYGHDSHATEAIVRSIFPIIEKKAHAIRSRNFFFFE